MINFPYACPSILPSKYAFLVARASADADADSSNTDDDDDDDDTQSDADDESGGSSDGTGPETEACVSFSLSRPSQLCIDSRPF